MDKLKFTEWVKKIDGSRGLEPWPGETPEAFTRRMMRNVCAYMDELTSEK